MPRGRIILFVVAQVLLECVVDKDEHCYPMVAAGAALDEMVFEQEVLLPSADRRLASISAP